MLRTSPHSAEKQPLQGKGTTAAICESWSHPAQVHPISIEAFHPLQPMLLPVLSGSPALVPSLEGPCGWLLPGHSSSVPLWDFRETISGRTSEGQSSGQ